ncbi:MAG TPA: hypothetical protein DCK99_10615 [Blastocatellia bacterium]|jgi:hypothetical protein|nr:hypothetical protein [Blastocatellia bacterium]
MKKQAYMIATMIMLLTVAGLSTAKAQTNGNTELRANIPFEFSVGNKTMPAGEYSVRCTNPTSDMKVLQLRSRNGLTSALVPTSSVIGKIQESAKLVFNRYGDQYFFSQAWLPADSAGMQASKSRNEKQIARELAGIKLSRESVAITARR